MIGNTRGARLLMLAAFIAGMFSCQSSTAPQEASTYHLTAVNHTVLPAQIQGLDFYNSYKWFVTAGTLVLDTNTYTETLSIQSYQANVLLKSYQTVENGTYAMQGNTITFTASRGFSYQGSISGNVLTYSTPSGGMQAYYVRQ